MKYSGKLSPFPEFTSDISHLLKIFVVIVEIKGKTNNN